MGKQHIIQLNGKTYDALSGHLVDLSTSTASPGASNIDGFMPIKRVARPTQHLKLPAKSVHAKPARAQTLKRDGLSRPHALRLGSRAVSGSALSASMSTAHERRQRASQVLKSPSVDRFSHASHLGVPKTTAPLTVKPAPHHVSPHPSASQAGPSNQAIPVQPSPAQSHQPAANAKSHLEMALENARPAVTKPLKKPGVRQRTARRLHLSPRTLGVMTSALAVLILGGFFAYQNIPNLSVRLAAARAGIPAHLPAYQPPGFSLKGPVKYSPGQITISYRSGTDNRSFSVTQTTSNWNSQALADNFLKHKLQSSQTVVDKGKTIYIYDDHNATWVDGGIWYRVEGNSSLNSDQLLQVASSI